MREQVAKGLSLTSEDEKSLTIMTIGSKREQTHVCNLVRLGLPTKDEISKQLMLFTVPTICEPIAGQPISICCNDFDHLAGLELTDYSDGNESQEIDILIGSDQYWELVTGETRHGDSGPVAIWGGFCPGLLPRLLQMILLPVCSPTLYALMVCKEFAAIR